MSPPERLKHLHQIAYGSPGMFPNQAAIEERLLTDNNDIVRHEAAFILADLFESSQLTDPLRAFATLVRSAGDRSILVRHEVALALAKFPMYSPLITLSRMLDDSAVEVRNSALFAIQELNPDSSNEAKL